MAINKLNTVLDQGPYGASVATINTNFELLWQDLALMRNASIKCKGAYSSYEALTTAWSSPEVGDWGCVVNGDTMNMYVCEVEGSWQYKGPYSGTLVEFEKYLTQADKILLQQSINAVDLKIQTEVDDEAQARDAAILQERTRALMAEQSIKSLLNASIDYSALPTMSVTDIACYGHPTRHVVTKTSGGKTYVIGILDTIATGDGNVITQTLKTRCKLDDNGNLDTTKFEAEVQVYERSYLVSLDNWYEDSRITDNGITIGTDTYTKQEVEQRLRDLQDTISEVLDDKADKADLNMGISQQVTGLKDAIISDVQLAETGYKDGISQRLDNMQTAINNKLTYQEAALNFATTQQYQYFEQNILTGIVTAVEKDAQQKYLTTADAQENYAGKDDVYTKDEIDVNVYTKDQVDMKLDDKANKSDLGSYYTKREADTAFVAKETNDHGSASDDPIAP